ncbi:hypothetical protein EBR61_02560 [bacterium]|nr:hypothetical protein [bacterium]
MAPYSERGLIKGSEQFLQSFCEGRFNTLQLEHFSCGTLCLFFTVLSSGIFSTLFLFKPIHSPQLVQNSFDSSLVAEHALQVNFFIFVFID